jgi:LmbE family N-acetylglucosaminyl deacetylase
MDNETQRVLLVLAHPDDPEFFCGATLAKWAREGKEIRYLLLTCGDKGGDRPDVTPEMLCADRQVEQRAAASIIGAKDVVFLTYHDGELVNSPDVRRDIVREIRRFKPHTVVTCDPTTYFRMGAYFNHADHRTAGAATLDAVFPAAGNLMYFPELLREGLEPHAPKELWISLTNEPNTWVDVTDTIAIKIAALKEHKSQIKDPAELEQRIRDRLRRPDVDREFYAEGFRVIKF